MIYKLTQTYINHIDLFSGIGGFALAAKEVWGDDYNNLFFCDYDQFCQRVLAKRFPGATIYGDIRTVANAPSDRRTGGGTTAPLEERYAQEPGNAGELAGGLERPHCDLLTGGFPCQPFSQAGQRKGTDDNRYLWPEMLRVIRAFQPTWVIAENVRGLLTIQQGMVFEQVCLDLEASGYEVQPLIIPAVAVNAPHRRDRVWFIAHRASTRTGSNYKRLWQEPIRNSGRQGTANSNTTKQGLERGDRTPRYGRTETNSNVKNTVSQRSGGGLESGRQILERGRAKAKDARPSWETNWPEVATLYGSVDDGISSWLDRCFKTIISENDYANCLKKDFAKTLRILRDNVQSEEFWQKVGGFHEVEQKEILHSLLCKLCAIAEGQDDVASEGKEAHQNNLRELWNDNEARRSPFRRQYQEQFAQQLKDFLSSLPHEMAQGTWDNEEAQKEMSQVRQASKRAGALPETLLPALQEIAKVWDCLWVAYSAMSNRSVALDGFKLSKSKHRAEQLKAYGNAIVPQVAVEIMKAIKQVNI